MKKVLVVSKPTVATKATPTPKPAPKASVKSAPKEKKKSSSKGTIKVSRDTNIIGETSYSVLDEKNEQIGVSFPTELEAHAEAQRIASMVGHQGNKKNSETIKEYPIG